MKKTYTNDIYDSYRIDAGELIIANCRGKKPVINEIKKARDLIRGILIELNQSRGKDTLSDIDNKLSELIKQNS